jgi:holin-like protein
MVLGATAWVVDKVYRFEISRQKHEYFQLSVLCLA